MSIYLQDESSIEINKKTWRMIIKPWMKAVVKWVECIHNWRHIFWLLRTDWKIQYSIKKNKKTKDFLESLYRLKEEDKSKYIMIILDNASIHKSKKVQKYCEERNIILVYLPPYSPDLNYIEHTWKKVKNEFKLIQWEDLSLENKIRKSIKKIWNQKSLMKKWNKKYL